MPAGSIVEHLDVIEDVGAGELAGFIDALAHALFLQAAEEGFSNRIDAPMSSLHAAIRQVSQDQWIQLAHYVALEAPLNFLRR